MKTMNIKAMLLIALVAVIASCSDERESDNSGGYDYPQWAVDFIQPTTDWGADMQTVKSAQSSELYLSSMTNDHLRYTNSLSSQVVDYHFEDNKLISACLTLSDTIYIDAIVKSALSGYTKLAGAGMSLLYYSKAEETLAFVKAIEGSTGKYVSIAWTYVDSDEDNSSAGPDFSPSGSENGYDYVDLGIGIGWAIQNVGAISTEKNGGYYMWGETISRSSSWWWYYSLYTGDTDSYLDESKFRTPYSNISGTSYDAATVKMGGKWRMPTRAECTSLINNCKIEVGEYNHTEGFIVTGPSGKSIFIPQAGRKKKDEVKSEGVSAYLWSSDTYSKPSAYCISINANGSAEITTWQKYYGISIRGVINL